MGIRSFVRGRKQVKADRATEQGIAGHQAAMKTLGTQMGYDVPPVVSSNVSIIPDELFGAKRVKSLSRPGSHTYIKEEQNEQRKKNHGS
jgi:hypothetical protein